MSATPLPAVPVTSPAVAASPSPAPARNSQSGQSAFNAHLQHVQRQQSSSSDEASSSKHDQGDQQAQQQTAGQANAQAGTQATSGADASDAGNAQTGAADDGSSGLTLSIPTSIGSLAKTVLSLIDQATGDSHGHAAANAKTAGAKPAADNQGNPQQAAGVVPPLLPPAATTGKASDNGTAAGSGVAALQAPGAGLAAGMQKSSLGDDGDDADGTDPGAVNAAGGDNASSTQGASDGSQTFAGVLSAIDHAASTVAGALPTTSSTSSSTPDLSSLNSALGASAVTAQPTATPLGEHTLSVNTPVGASGFAKELGQQVTWLSGQDIKQAQIRLNPENLGPLDVKVSVEHGRVDVAFMTQHVAAATAVQQGLDQLHQMLGAQGLSLGHTSVGQHASQQQFANSQQQQQQSGAQTTADSDQATGSSTAETLKRVAIGLVDAFA
ncbi:flagellar hook-length control protein FliK [Dyella mobilis]|uniref:Flagellar hook-length control protein FliK n=1 Tax=Dyella mobilis TaxID=1849582 RepID=A0ABS2KBA7_9GAMM|nr:flagellar hook-length control protein FliK [Dyella mobilis]MBM7128095.1 flagellar hook-length control protein FliK [Dyella mobilis]GLQ99911.1 hypothetical protein GCM10007863_43310 [Dyella mobilis]